MHAAQAMARRIFKAFSNSLSLLALAEQQQQQRRGLKIYS